MEMKKIRGVIKQRSYCFNTFLSLMSIIYNIRNEDFMTFTKSFSVPMLLIVFENNKFIFTKENIRKITVCFDGL